MKIFGFVMRTGSEKTFWTLLLSLINPSLYEFIFAFKSLQVEFMCFQAHEMTQYALLILDLLIQFD